jgi:hypothetical protein
MQSAVRVAQEDVAICSRESDWKEGKGIVHFLFRNLIVLG